MNPSFIDIVNYIIDQMNKEPRFASIQEYYNEFNKRLLVELNLPIVSNCALSMEEILNEAQRRQAKYSVQYDDYSLETWTVASDLLEHRKNNLLADASVRKVRVEYEM